MIKLVRRPSLTAWRLHPPYGVKTKYHFVLRYGLLDLICCKQIKVVRCDWLFMFNYYGGRKQPALQEPNKTSFVWGIWI